MSYSTVVILICGFQLQLGVFKGFPTNYVCARIVLLLLAFV